MRTDGTLINGTGAAARPGDVLELYGTGLGPTSPSVAPGLVYQGSAPTTNPVTVTIGAIPADVSYAGLTGAGLYQINITVPLMSDGDYPVVAQVAGLSTQSGVLLKIQS